jgi:fumarate reductase flavoprotein subunit
MTLFPAADLRADLSAPIVIVGAGACGLIAALAAREAGHDPIVLERDRVPTGSTSLSSGFIPAAGTRFQRAIGVLDDSPALFAADILAKNKFLGDAREAARVADAVGPALEWLQDRHGIPFEVLEGFLYPGHARLRMHAVPEHTGAALLVRLQAAADAAGVQVICDARVENMFADADGRVRGVGIARPDGAREMIGCEALILACNGYGGSPELMRQNIPEMAGALYFGHAGNQGDALRWGHALGADVRDLTGYQGHGSVAHPHGVLITWALLMEGGIQVNSEGVRFWNEHEGYSEAAVAVLAQPGGIAFDIFDARLHTLGQTFEDYRQAEAAGAIRRADDVSGLARVTGLPEAALAETLAEVGRLARDGGTDRFGRVFSAPPLAPPWFAVRVTGALFHTQGGLVVDDEARVLRADGTRLPNLFAGGGAARGVSGPHVSGYLSGNGLLTAVALGRIAGRAAGDLVSARTALRGPS